MKIQILLILIALLIFFYDLKYRAIPVWLFLLMGLLLISLNYPARTSSEYFSACLINLTILGLQLGVMRLFIYLRSGKKAKFINGSFGGGDVLMLALLCFSFSPIHYTFFIILSCLAGILFRLLPRKISSNSTSIPFAGILSLGYAILLLISLIFVSPALFYSKSL